VLQRLLMSLAEPGSERRRRLLARLAPAGLSAETIAQATGHLPFISFSNLLSVLSPSSTTTSCFFPLNYHSYHSCNRSHRAGPRHCSSAERGP